MLFLAKIIIITFRLQEKQSKVNDCKPIATAYNDYME